MFLSKVLYKNIYMFLILIPTDVFVDNNSNALTYKLHNLWINSKPYLKPTVVKV